MSSSVELNMLEHPGGNTQLTCSRTRSRQGTKKQQRRPDLHDGDDADQTQRTPSGKTTNRVESFQSVNSKTRRFSSELVSNPQQEDLLFSSSASDRSFGSSLWICWRRQRPDFFIPLPPVIKSGTWHTQR